jgi:Ca-activated chloride channel family protein
MRRSRLIEALGSLFTAAALLTGCGAAGQSARDYSGTTAAAPMKMDYSATAGDPASMPAGIATPAQEAQGTEDYKDYGVNPITDPAKDRLSTFAIDVDTASYAISRRKIMEGSLPPYQAVRAEEFLNYFDYAYPSPTSGAFAVHLAAAPSPFAQGRHLLRVAIQGKRIDANDRKPVHLVYLVDTSGSMQSHDKIPSPRRASGCSRTR